MLEQALKWFGENSVKPGIIGHYQVQRIANSQGLWDLRPNADAPDVLRRMETPAAAAYPPRRRARAAARQVAAK